mgnify:CR=1 FL=1
MKKLISLLSIIFFSACTLNVQIPTNSPNQKYDIGQAHKSVGEIFVGAAKVKGGLSGTAFALDDEFLLTAGHVCVGILEYQASGDLKEEIILITMKDGFKQEFGGVELVEVDEPHDVCLVKRKNHGLAPIKFISNYEDLKFRDRVWVVGAPLGMLISEQEGRVMDVNLDEFPFKDKLLISSAVAGGNSGSPVFNDVGEVVGMLIAGSTAYDHLGICTKSSTIQRFLKLTGHLD